MVYRASVKDRVEEENEDVVFMSIILIFKIVILILDLFPDSTAEFPCLARLLVAASSYKYPAHFPPSLLRFCSLFLSFSFQDFRLPIRYLHFEPPIAFFLHLQKKDFLRNWIRKSEDEHLARSFSYIFYSLLRLTSTNEQFPDINAVWF